MLKNLNKIKSTSKKKKFFAKFTLKLKEIFKFLEYSKALKMSCFVGAHNQFKPNNKKIKLRNQKKKKVNQ